MNYSTSTTANQILKLVQISIATLLTIILFIHTLLSYTTTPSMLMITLLSSNSWLTCSAFVCALLIFIFALYLRRPPSIYLLDYSCYKPDFDRKCSFEACDYILRRSSHFTPTSQNFMRGIYSKSGLGDETYAPPFLLEEKEPSRYEQATLASAVQELEEGMFSAVDSVLHKTKLDTELIDIVIVGSGTFASVPSLSSVLVHRYRLRSDVKTFNLSGMGCSSGVMCIDAAARVLGGSTQSKYALVVVTESISLNWYLGEDRSMLVTNCIFRVGCAAAIITSDPSQRRFSKSQIIGSLRTHHGADDRSYEAAFQKEDQMGNLGISLTKDLIRVAGVSLRDHIRCLAPRVLPLSQLVYYAYSVASQAVLIGWGNSKPIVPDFMAAFEHLCIHTGGKAVIEQVGKVLSLGEYITEPARMSLHRFGNTSSSLVFYELAYFEAKGRVKKGDRMWMLAFGTGFKVCSIIFKSLRDSHCDEEDNPWKDCIGKYPLKTW